jgi:molybdopterin-guanine dinucleotide biosynthesis protein A
MRMTDSIQGFILTGGASRRMGADKASLLVDGKTFVERIAQELLPISSSVKLVGNIAGNSKFETVPDVYPAWGALGGVHAALTACSADWAFVVACDFPFVTTELFRQLASLREDAEAVAPIQHDEIPQPLCTLYRQAPCLAAATELIKTGERKPIALLQSVRTRWVRFSELSNLTDANHFFDNINTPEDYARLSEDSARTTQR